MVGNPIKVTQFKNPLNNVRQQMFEDESLKIIGKKGIILKGYMTEQERLAKIEEENKFNQSLLASAEVNPKKHTK